MRRIKLIVAYDGTNYCGWQVQPNGITVQEVLNQALSDLFAKKIACIISAGSIAWIFVCVIFQYLVYYLSGSRNYGRRFISSKATSLRRFVLPALFLQKEDDAYVRKLALELTALAFLFQCIRFIWKIEIERYKMRKKKPSTTANRRRKK